MIKHSHLPKKHYINILVRFQNLYKTKTGLDYIISWGKDLKILNDTQVNESDIDNFFKLWEEKKDSFDGKVREFWALPTLNLFRYVINEVKAYKPVPQPIYYREL